MAQTSRKVRKERRIRRERSLALKMMDEAVRQRDEARYVASFLEHRLKQLEDKSSSKLEITRIPEDDEKDNAGPSS